MYIDVWDAMVHSVCECIMQMAKKKLSDISFKGSSARPQRIARTFPPSDPSLLDFALGYYTLCHICRTVYLGDNNTWEVFFDLPPPPGFLLSCNAIEQIFNGI
jgi:hypothetical protein